jgi:hypothetical protein
MFVRNAPDQHTLPLNLRIYKHNFRTIFANIPFKYQLIVAKFSQTSYAKKDATKGHPPTPPRFLQKTVHAIWREGLKYMGVPYNNVVDSYDANAHKPDGNNWSKEETNSVCAIMLQCEQAYKY